MDFDYKYKLLKTWIEEKQNGRSRLDMLLNLELGKFEEFEVIGVNTMKNKEMVNILNFIFNEKELKYYANIYRKDKIRINRREKIPRKRNIKLWQLVDAGIIKDRLKLFFYDHSRRKKYENEYAIVDFHSNLYVGERTDKSNDMLLYGRIPDSPSKLAEKLRSNHGLSEGETMTQGPIYWITENGETLDDLNNKARRMGL